jgi:MoaA/NifB/PqqE/SkfB family radical SAM enzyme
MGEITIEKNHKPAKKLKILSGREIYEPEINNITIEIFDFYGHTSWLHDFLIGKGGDFDNKIESVRYQLKKGVKIRADLNINENNYLFIYDIFKFLVNLGIKKILLELSENKPPLRQLYSSLKEIINFARENDIEINFNKYHKMLGVLFNEVFTGPDAVQFDVMATCNHNCIYCWWHSPLIKNKYPAFKKLDFSEFKSILDELYDMGLTLVIFSGPGEPFLHPEFMKMIAYVKKKGLGLEIYTNGTTLTKKILIELSKMKVDLISFNISASNPKLYAKMHFNQNEKSFELLKNLLKWFSAYKKENNLMAPMVSVVNIITNQNCEDIENMFIFSKEIDAQEIKFHFMMSFPDVESLRINNEQFNSANEAIKLSQKKYAIPTYMLNLEYGSPTKPAENIFNGCYAGWYFARIQLDKKIDPCCVGSHRIDWANSFSETWNSETYKEFRKRTKLHSNEYCNNCNRGGRLLGTIIIKDELEKEGLSEFL